MKTAIILASKEYFDMDGVLKDGARHWLDALYDTYGTCDVDGVKIFLDPLDFAKEYNNDCFHGFDDFMVTVDYESFDGKHFKCDKYDSIYNISARFCVICKTGVFDGDKRIESAEIIRDIALSQFGNKISCQIWGYYNDDDDYRFDVYVTGDKSYILNEIATFCHRVYDEVFIADGCELEWSVDGNNINQVTYDGDEQCYFDSNHLEDELIVPDECKGEQELIDEQKLIDEAIERANGELAECIIMLHNCKNLQDVYELVDNGSNDMSFGNDDYSNKDYIGICYKSIQFDVMDTCNGGIMIAGDRVQVFNDEGHELWTGTLNEEDVDGVEAQDNCNIYLKPDAKPEPKKEEPKLDGEFLDHVADILREGHRVICVELSGKKYVINGLFDNEDLIIDTYVADTMERIDRYIVIGAQDGEDNEAQYYVEHFMEKVANDKNLCECWYLTDKQFQFLKNA